ncbi:MAG: EFR1 family ferrodoxin [Clostridiales bacterium]|nr:EFR1 family ferrodoxin [Clostridiales bacterium]
MKSVGIFYFSGTGNTEIIAEMIREAFAERDYQIDLIRMEDVLKNSRTINPADYDLIGIGSPVLGYTSPKIVRDFIRILPKILSKESRRKVFIFRTAAGVAPVNYNASKPIIRQLAARGYDVLYERIFSISSNWIFKYDDDVILKLYEASRKKADLLCSEVISGKKRLLKTSPLRRAMMEFVMLADRPFLRMVSKDYVVSASCSHCGLCVKNCPSANIREKNGKIKFGMSCNSCLRCVYSCPKNAIGFRTLSFFAVPGGYNIKKILAHPCPPDEKDKRSEPPFFKAYVGDIDL